MGCYDELGIDMTSAIITQVVQKGKVVFILSCCFAGTGSINRDVVKCPETITLQQRKTEMLTINSILLYKTGYKKSRGN